MEKIQPDYSDNRSALFKRYWELKAAGPERINQTALDVLKITGLLVGFYIPFIFYFSSSMSVIFRVVSTIPILFWAAVFFFLQKALLFSLPSLHEVDFKSLEQHLDLITAEKAHQFDTAFRLFIATLLLVVILILSSVFI